MDSGWFPEPSVLSQDTASFPMSRMSRRMRCSPSAARSRCRGCISGPLPLSVSVDYLLGRTDQRDLRDDRVHATFRRLSDASAETIDRAVRVVEALLDQDDPKKE